MFVQVTSLNLINIKIIRYLYNYYFKIYKISKDNNRIHEF